MEKINIAVVGLRFGRLVAEDIAYKAGKDYFNLYALCDRDRGYADWVEEQFKFGTRMHYDMDEVLANPDIQSVAIITPPGGRAKLIEKALRAGKHVMTTKPFESDPEEAVRVLDLAKKLNLALHINSPSPVPTQDIALIREWREKYGLGRPVAARGEAHRLEHQKADGRWLDDPEKCPAAPVTRIGIYLINDLVRIFGKAMKAGVSCSTVLTKRPTPDNAHLSILFENGGLGSVYASFCAASETGQENGLYIKFENGVISRRALPNPDDGESKGAAMSVRMFSRGKPAQAEERTVSRISGAYLWDAFFRAIRGDKLEDEIEPWQIAEGIRVLNAMAKSEKTGKFESIDRPGPCPH
jgi:predicted dehydrogenase